MRVYGGKYRVERAGDLGDPVTPGSIRGLVVLAAVVAGCGARTGVGIDESDAGARGPADATVEPDAPAADTGSPPLADCVEHGPPLALASVTPDGAPSVGGAGSPTISHDGRFVVFVSSAGDLVADDFNDELDVFVRDRQRGTTTRVSVATDGTEGDDASGFRLITGRPSITADGSMVAFPSNSDLLHPDDDNRRTDIYLHTLSTGETRFVPVEDERFVGGDSPVLSADGRYVAFAAFQLDWAIEDGVAAFQPLRVDLATGENRFLAVDERGELGDEADDLLSTGVPLTQRILSITADGRRVAFASGSKNLERVDDTYPDVFVADADATTLEEITDDADEESLGPSLSADGRFVAFHSSAESYPDPDTTVYVRDRATGELHPVPRAHGFPVISGDGRYVSFIRERRVVVHDRRTGADAEVAPDPPLGEDDIQHVPYLGGDGCWVTFLWSEGPVTQVWVARNPLR